MTVDLEVYELYIICSLAIGFVALLGYLLYRLSNYKIHMDFLTKEHSKATGALDSLNAEKIYNIKHIQELTSQVQYIQQSAQDQERARKEAFDSAKASLFDLGSGLSKQLLELHKQENMEVKQQSEKHIAATAEKFNNEFQKIVSMVGALSREIDNSKSTVDLIKNSLLSPSGAGQLAEITLENILKASGLKCDVDFKMQHNLQNAEGRLRPDAVVFLPSDNLMVIDAKASKFLVEMGGAIDDAASKALAAELLKTMNRHLKSLVSREYAESMTAHYHVKSKNVGNVITLMFLPSECALERVSEIDPEFMNRAFMQNIFPVGPAGLMNMLSFARFQINDHQRSKNHHLIIEEVRRLLASVSTLAEHSQRIGNNIQNLANNYDKFSASFNRNFLPKARKIQHLGVDLGKEVIKPLDRYHMISADSDLIEVEQSEAYALKDKEEV